VGVEYVGLAFVVESYGEEVEIRASLRGDNQDWGGYLIGAADWLGIASSGEPFFELRLPDGRSGAAFVSDFDTAATDQRVTIAGVGAAPFG
jgi:N-acetylneuraminic acid mutarotase